MEFRRVLFRSPVPPGKATRKRSRATTRTSSLSDRPTRASSGTAEPSFPTAAEYASARACHGALTVVDLQAEQAAVTADYDNRVLLDVDDHSMRLPVFEGEYRWHYHPESDGMYIGRSEEHSRGKVCVSRCVSRGC